MYVCMYVCTHLFYGGSNVRVKCIAHEHNTMLLTSYHPGPLELDHYSRGIGRGCNCNSLSPPPPTMSCGGLPFMDRRLKRKQTGSERNEMIVPVYSNYACYKGHVSGGFFSCNLHCNKHCIASGQKSCQCTVFTQ